MRKVTELPAGGKLEVTMDSNPFQLYDLLQQRGFQLRVTPGKEGGFVGEISAREGAGHG